MSRSPINDFNKHLSDWRPWNPARGYAVSLSWKVSLVWLCLSWRSCRNGEAFAESVIREIYEETGLTIKNPQLVGVKNWLWIQVGATLSFVIRRPSLLEAPIIRRGWSFLDEKRPDSKLGSGLWYATFDGDDGSFGQIWIFLPSPYRRRLGKENLLVF